MQNLRDKQRRKRSCSNTRRNFYVHLDQNHRARKKRAPSRALYSGKRKQTLLHSCFVILNSHGCNITETWSKRLLRKRHGRFTCLAASTATSLCVRMHVTGPRGTLWKVGALKRARTLCHRTPSRDVGWSRKLALQNA